MSSFQYLEETMTEMAQEKWTVVSLSLEQCRAILDANRDEIARSPDDLVATSVRLFLSRWCRDNILGQWSIWSDLSFSLRANGEIKEPRDIVSVRASFRTPSEAMRFKLTWGGVVS